MNCSTLTLVRVSQKSSKFPPTYSIRKQQANAVTSAFLESICKPLYDRLRQRIVAETQLVRLCELCTLLQTRYIRDQEDCMLLCLMNQD